MDINQVIAEFQNCECGKKHEVGIKEVAVGSGITKDTGDILKRNGFQKKLLLVADQNTLSAAQGVEDSLTDAGFVLTRLLYENLRTAEMEEVNRIEKLLGNADGVIAVGTGSIHDICRLASARKAKPLCLFATAASMDGFCSYSAPITDNGFKNSYAAKTPEVIIADTQILASAPDELKSAGFGDMVGKYVGLIDWQVSNLLIGEYYCTRVADLTRRATDTIMAIADRVLEKDEAAAQAVFEALLLTGIGMAFVQSSRPASGSEHVLSHYWECIKLSHGQLSDFHGKKVGVATLIMLDEYEKMTQSPTVQAHRESVDWAAVYANYGALSGEVRALNTPDTIADAVDPKAIEDNWARIRDIVKSVPSKEAVYAAMKQAGCATTIEEIGVTEDLKQDGLAYHTYMRRRLSLYRLKNMI